MKSLKGYVGRAETLSNEQLEKEFERIFKELTKETPERPVIKVRIKVAQ